MQDDIQQFIGDLAEEIRYLKELGVENLNAGVPEMISTASAAASPPRLPQAAGKVENLAEKFVPEDLPIKIEKKTEDFSTSPRRSRRGILDETKLSKLPEIPKRNPLFSVPSVAEKDEQMEKPNERSGIEMATKRQSAETIEIIRSDIGECVRCALSAGRTQIVHSTGNRRAEVMFVGEAPGADEDLKGEPFVGRAGQLLTKIIEGIQLKREEVFIGNVNRCRPPGNRQPTTEESAACKPFLLREIAVVKPKVIVVMGNTATQNLLDTKIGITKLRGKFHDYFGVKVMPTFHPAYLLRDPRKKREVWEDMKMVRDEIRKTD